MTETISISAKLSLVVSKSGKKAKGLATFGTEDTKDVGGGHRGQNRYHCINMLKFLKNIEKQLKMFNTVLHE